MKRAIGAYTTTEKREADYLAHVFNSVGLECEVKNTKNVFIVLVSGQAAHNAGVEAVEFVNEIHRFADKLSASFWAMPQYLRVEKFPE